MQGAQQFFAAVGAGYFDTVSQAQEVYCETYQTNYFPNSDRHELYETMYQKYLALGEFMENII